MGSGSGGEQTLASSASDKKRAAKYLEETLMPDTGSASRMGDGGGARPPLLVAPTAPASPLIVKQDTGLKGLGNWASDQGISDALVAWQGSAGKLMGRLQMELSGLHGTKNLLQGTDVGVGSQAGAVRPPSSFDGM
ncbi:hypothetical protein [Streptomyces sp. cg35]|uniref:hypothetical protein n=1 Tax=Streptomyces sp. cg35 TaxID=3421650 RepID=UPI003D16A3D2